ncbi:MAG: M15 family metallopeptidase [Fimbriimonadales bacterium]|nr:M15 family metallopeptidase [Fimbriimonadales bacterium]
MSALRKPNFRDHLLGDPRVHPKARELFQLVLKELREAGYPAVVVEVYRSPERQRMLYAQGRTDAQLKAEGYTEQEIRAARAAGRSASKPVVTKRKDGMHAQGRAMDVAWLINNRISWDAPEQWWQAYGRIAKKYGLRWGGDWKTFPDRGHVEYRGE